MKKFKESLKLAKLAKISNGKLILIENLNINSVSTLEEADKTSLAFYQNKKFHNSFLQSKAGVILIPKDENISGLPKRNYILCEKPYFSFLMAVSYFLEKEKIQISGQNIHPNASIDSSVKLPKNIRIAANVIIEKNVEFGNNIEIEANTIVKNNSQIGDNSHIFPNVTIYQEVSIGKNVHIHAGCVIGSDGFGYLWDGKKHRKIPQIGKVMIEDNVELGANVTVDRGTLCDTIIREGSKIDNLVQIGHNVILGKNSIVCAQSGIAGSSEIGESTILAGQVGVADHIKVGKNVIVAAKSGVSKNVPNGKTIFGYPATDAHLQRRMIASLRELPKMRKILHRLIEEEKNGTKK